MKIRGLIRLLRKRFNLWKADLLNPPDCRFYSQQLYDDLRKKTAYWDVRIAVGRWKGRPHQWVELWNGYEWVIQDPSTNNPCNVHYQVNHYQGWTTVMKHDYPELYEERK